MKYSEQFLETYAGTGLKVRVDNVDPVKLKDEFPTISEFRTWFDVFVDTGYEAMMHSTLIADARKKQSINTCITHLKTNL